MADFFLESFSSQAIFEACLIRKALTDINALASQTLAETTKNPPNNLRILNKGDNKEQFSQSNVETWKGKKFPSPGPGWGPRLWRRSGRPRGIVDCEGGFPVFGSYP